MNYVIFNKNFNKNETYQNVFEVIEEINGIKIKELLEQKHDQELDDAAKYRMFLRQTNLGEAQKFFFIQDENKNFIGEIKIQFASKELYQEIEYDCDFCKGGSLIRYTYYLFWSKYYQTDYESDDIDCSNCNQGSITIERDINTKEDNKWLPLMEKIDYREYQDFRLIINHKNLLENK